MIEDKNLDPAVADKIGEYVILKGKFSLSICFVCFKANLKPTMDVCWSVQDVDLSCLLSSRRTLR
jgi:hypothetical protein